MTATNPPGDHAHTHEDGLNAQGRSQIDGLKPNHLEHFKDMVRKHFAVHNGVVIWIEAPHPKAEHLVGWSAGYQAVTKLQGRTYNGNIFINFLGQRYLAQDIAWVLYNGEHVPEGMRLIHLDGDKANNEESNLHLQKKPGFKNEDS